MSERNDVHDLPEFDHPGASMPGVKPREDEDHQDENDDQQEERRDGFKIEHAADGRDENEQLSKEVGKEER